MQEIIEYDWPENIRELENVIEQAVIVGDTNFINLRKSPTTANESTKPKGADDSIDEGEIKRVLKLAKGKIVRPDGAACILNMRPSKLEEFERHWIVEALQKADGRIRGENGAADLIGMKPTTLEARVKKLNIKKSEIFR